MPTKNENSGQLFYKTNSEEYELVGEPIEIFDIIENMKNEVLTAAFGQTEINIPLSESASREISEHINKLIMNDIWKDFRKLSCNNWCKMHHLPLIRRKGMRK